MRKMVYEAVCIENGDITGKVAEKLAIGQSAAAGSGGQAASTSSKKVDSVDHALHKSSVNAMVVAVELLNNPDFRRRLRLFVEATRSVHEWHKDQNTSLRSAGVSKRIVDASFVFGSFDFSGVANVHNLSREVSEGSLAIRPTWSMHGQSFGNPVAPKGLPKKCRIGRSKPLTGRVASNTFVQSGAR